MLPLTEVMPVGKERWRFSMRIVLASAGFGTAIVAVEFGRRAPLARRIPRSRPCAPLQSLTGGGHGHSRVTLRCLERPIYSGASGPARAMQSRAPCPAQSGSAGLEHTRQAGTVAPELYGSSRAAASLWSCLPRFAHHVQSGRPTPEQALRSRPGGQNRPATPEQGC